MTMVESLNFFSILIRFDRILNIENLSSLTSKDDMVFFVRATSIDAYKKRIVDNMFISSVGIISCSTSRIEYLGLVLHSSHRLSPQLEKHRAIAIRI